jgi:putative tryptophan/tyrosine transport system substrate-binding protein
VKRREFLAGCAVIVFARAALAQQQRAPARIVLLIGSAEPPGIGAFEEELGRLGWVIGKTAIIDRRNAEGDAARVRVLAAEAVASYPDVIVANHTPNVVALRDLTRTIPVVAANIGDPIGLGLTESLSRPSANFTGFVSFTDDLTAKRLELLRRIVPAGRRVALLLNPANPLFPRVFESARAAAAPLDWEVLVADYDSAAAVLPAIEKTRTEGADAMVVLPDPLAQVQVRAVAARAGALKIPALFLDREDLADGALIVYGTDRGEGWRQAAQYADRLLRGAKAAELPFVQASHIILGINLKAARELGLTLPADILARADEVIE